MPPKRASARKKKAEETPTSTEPPKEAAASSSSPKKATKTPKTATKSKTKSPAKTATKATTKSPAKTAATPVAKKTAKSATKTTAAKSATKTTPNKTTATKKEAATTEAATTTKKVTLKRRSIIPKSNLPTSTSPKSPPTKKARTKAKKPPAKPVSLDLPVQTFSLPQGDDFELWTIRLPISCPLDNLDGVQISVPKECVPSQANSAVMGADGKSTSEFIDKDTSFSFQWGHPAENQSFRILLSTDNPEIVGDDNDVTKDSDKAKSAERDADADSSDDNDDEKKEETNGSKPKSVQKVYKMHVSSIPFHRHVNVVNSMKEVSETNLAPRIESAPPVQDTTLRRAYQTVPQRTGMKRRFTPIGASFVGGQDSPLDTKPSQVILAAGAVATAKKVSLKSERKRKKSIEESEQQELKRVKTEEGVTTETPKVAATTPQNGISTFTTPTTSATNNIKTDETQISQEESKEMNTKTEMDTKTDMDTEETPAPEKQIKKESKQARKDERFARREAKKARKEAKKARKEEKALKMEH